MEISLSEEEKVRMWAVPAYEGEDFDFYGHSGMADKQSAAELLEQIARTFGA
jgi:hypothetical protein